MLTNCAALELHWGYISVQAVPLGNKELFDTCHRPCPRLKRVDASGPHVVLGNHLFSGRIYATYTATSSDSPRPRTDTAPNIREQTITPSNLIVKVHHSQLWEEAAWKEVSWEAWIYANRLKPGITPTWYGLFGTRETVQRKGVTSRLVVAVMEHGGKRVHKPKHLPLAAKKKIIALYTALHACGVIHHSAFKKHWMWRGGDPETLRLIDFGVSCLLDLGDVPKAMRAKGNVIGGTTFAGMRAKELASVGRELGLSPEDVEEARAEAMVAFKAARAREALAEREQRAAVVAEIRRFRMAELDKRAKAEEAAATEKYKESGAGEVENAAIEATGRAAKGIEEGGSDSPAKATQPAEGTTAFSTLVNSNDTGPSTLNEKASPDNVKCPAQPTADRGANVQELKQEWRDVAIERDVGTERGEGRMCTLCCCVVQ